MLLSWATDSPRNMYVNTIHLKPTIINSVQDLRSADMVLESRNNLPTAIDRLVNSPILQRILIPSKSPHKKIQFAYSWRANTQIRSLVNTASALDTYHPCTANLITGITKPPNHKRWRFWGDKIPNLLVLAWTSPRHPVSVAAPSSRSIAVYKWPEVPTLQFSQEVHFHISRYPITSSFTFL